MGIPHTFLIRIQNAQHVSVVGEFNNWQTTANALEKVGEDLWQITLPLEAGQYRYAYFVIDSRWSADRPAGISPTRMVGHGSWAHVSSEPWGTAQHQQRAHERLSAA